MYILRAGLTGCLAALRFPDAKIIDSAEGPQYEHQALLRMRSDEIPKLTGIDFENVLVDKYIWDCSERQYRTRATPRDMIEYSRKTNGRVEVRSIADLGTEFRYIPPHDFHERLIDMIQDRIYWNIDVKSIHKGKMLVSGDSIHESPIVSTLPMEHNLSLTQTHHAIDFDTRTKPIYVTRIRFNTYNLHLTVYFPGPQTNIYRASFTNNELIVESVKPLGDRDYNTLEFCFGYEHTEIGGYVCKDKMQKRGKIIAIDDESRKHYLYEMSNNHGLWSLGRFACWRNVLLDDCIQDMNKISQMIATSPYDRSIPK